MRRAGCGIGNEGSPGDGALPPFIPPSARRTPRSGADADWPGDIMGVPGYVVEAKRQERLNIWEALRQVYAAAETWVARESGSVPVLCFRRNAKPGQVAIAWQLAQPGITAPIASATSPAQLSELVGAVDLKLDATDIEQLTKASA